MTSSRPRREIKFVRLTAPDQLTILCKTVATSQQIVLERTHILPMPP